MKVYFELGAYATKGAHVDTISLSLARDSKVILGGNARFSPDTGELNLPIDVNPGEKKSIRYKITGTSPTEPLALSDADAKELCAGQVMVQGNVTYTGSSAPLPISAAPVTVSGCP